MAKKNTNNDDGSGNDAATTNENDVDDGTTDRSMLEVEGDVKKKILKKTATVRGECCIRTVST